MSEQTMSYKCLVGIEEKCTFWDRSENKYTNPNFVLYTNKCTNPNFVLYTITNLRIKNDSAL